MDTISATVRIRDESTRVTLARCGPAGERHSWRVDAPGEEHDGWLMSDEDLTDPDPASLVRPSTPEGGDS